MFLVESALLTHGLRSISNDEIKKLWICNDKNICWVNKGNIIIGNIDEFLLFRNRQAELIRIDCNTLDNAIKQKLSGALTASGTMEVCQRNGIKLAVTCGMGGIGDIKGEELCPDLPALVNIPVSLISTSPKDMLDVEKTISWLKDNSVHVCSNNSDFCTGYIFNSCKVPIRNAKSNLCVKGQKQLILNPILSNERVSDISILDKAIKAGKAAEKQGKYYHPAVNGEIDRLTKGYSSLIQLKSLIANISFAQKIC